MQISILTLFGRKTKKAGQNNLKQATQKKIIRADLQCKIISVTEFEIQFHCYSYNVRFLQCKIISVTKFEIQFQCYSYKGKKVRLRISPQWSTYSTFCISLCFSCFENMKCFAYENMKICQNSMQHLSELLTCALPFYGKVSCMIWLKLSFLAKIIFFRLKLSFLAKIILFG